MKKILILLLMICTLNANEVSIKGSTISQSTIIIFNGKEFDLTTNSFFNYIKQFPDIENKLKEYFVKNLQN